MPGVPTHADLGGAKDPTAPSEMQGIARASVSSVEPARAEQVDAGLERRMVIVPRRPGLLREYDSAPQRPRDELDTFIDDVFGGTTNEKPGPFDVGLVVVGLLLAAWASILDGPKPALWFGIAAIVLGLALPVRAALRKYGWSRTGGLRRHIIDGGLLLDASYPATLALIDAYTHLIQMSCLQGTGDPKRAVAAGHLAVVEVATHLDGRTPDTPARVRFVSVRTSAIEALTRQMMRSHDRWAAKTAVQPPLSTKPSTDEQVAASEWGALNALTRTPGLAELERLDQQLRRETAIETD